MTNKFEKTIFCKWEPTADDDYLGTYESLEETAEVGEVVRVAEYRLVKIHGVTTKVETK